jgi:hypothetical protein
MTNYLLRKFALLFIPILVLGSAQLFAQATITIANGNAPGVGFNDPTPAAPVGGNSGTTLGQQRLNAFQYAADIWGSKLASNVEIKILATFEPLSCTSTAAVLGSAGTLYIWANFPSMSPFPGPEFLNTWYSSALAKKRAGYDFYPYDTASGEADIRARFNVNLGNIGCLDGVGWYLGFDNNAGTQIDLVTVLLHEFSHGLGFQQFASVTTGSQIAGLTDVYGRQLLDKTLNKTWDQMTDAERAASAINTRKVVWTGPTVNTTLPGVLQLGTPLLNITAPAAIAGIYPVGTASFGPPLSSPGVSGTVVQASPADACLAIGNSAEVAGKIAIVDRGTCAFVVKVKNAQDAGAIGVLIADNVAGSPPAGLGGADPTITIPSVRITLADGNTIKAQLATGVNANLGLDLTVFAGADEQARALMNTPNPVQPGSTISHWDPIAFPNQLMEPAINSDLTHSVDAPKDLTLPLMRDIGWFPDADLDGVADSMDSCEPNSDVRSTVIIGSCDSGAPNTYFSSGCTISDYIRHIAASAKNHGDFVSGVALLIDQLKRAGIITGRQQGTIGSCAAGATIP